MLTRLSSLKQLLLSLNGLMTLGLLPSFMTSEAMWMKSQDPVTMAPFYLNILTKEKCSTIHDYDGSGIQNTPQLHDFQVQKHFIRLNYIQINYYAANRDFVV